MKIVLFTITLFMITFICIESCFAQEDYGTAGKRFGLFAGMNVSNMNFNKGYPSPPVPVAAAWKSGITIGFLADIPLFQSFFLQPEYSYSHRNGSDKSTAKNYSTGYFSLPLLLNYKVSPRFSVLAGPQAELLIYANSDSNGIKTSITHDVEERSIGAVIGVDVRLINSFFISARYLHGLNHIGIGQRSAIKEFKYEVVNLSVGVRF